jgi:hypothetical protein
LHSGGVTDCPVPAITITRCDGRDNTGVRYPPICALSEAVVLIGRAAHIGLVCVPVCHSSVTGMGTAVVLSAT